MSNNIYELTQALRDAATKIEASANFRFTEEIDLASGIALLLSVKPSDKSLTLVIDIELPYGNSQKEEDVKVSYALKESYTTKCESESFKGVIESYVASREGKDSLASVARLVKAANKESSQDSPTVIDSPTCSL